MRNYRQHGIGYMYSSYKIFRQHFEKAVRMKHPELFICGLNASILYKKLIPDIYFISNENEGDFGPCFGAPLNGLKSESELLPLPRIMG